MDGSLLAAQEHRITALAPDWAARVWPQVEHYIAKALKRGGLERAYQPQDVLADVLLGSCLLWIVSRGDAANIKIDAAIVTRRIDYRRCSTVYVSLIGGSNLKAWWDKAEDAIDKYAKGLPSIPGTAGVVGLEGGNRKGWARKPGWEVTGVMMRKFF